MVGLKASSYSWWYDNIHFLICLGSLQSKEGKSPLHMAAIHGRFTRSQILIQNGK